MVRSLLCAAVRPASADERPSPVLQSPVIQNQVVQSLRALGLPAPDAYASRAITLDLSAIRVPSMGGGFALPDTLQ